MADAGAIIDFFKSRVATVGISSLVLAILEKMMDINFVCPCQPGYNEAIAACYAIVPFIGCFFLTYRFVDLRPQDEGMENISRHQKCYYSFLIAFIWLCLFFLDGRYLACGRSYWQGKYTETDNIPKWCKPNANDTVVFELERETQKSIAISQICGFVIFMVITFFVWKLKTEEPSLDGNGRTQQNESALLECTTRNPQNTE